MLSGKIVIRRGGSDEGEKPFWISYADLMTALMVLFLVVMVIALLSVTQQIRSMKKAEVERTQEINELLSQIEHEAENFDGISVSRERLTIDFGEKARFGVGDYRLADETVLLLRQFVPELLRVAKSDLGQRWFKRVLVEGFTDTTGSYLYNLDLSLKRAHSVVCSLVSPRPGMPELSAEDATLIRSLFLVGGFSFNAQRASLEESRRVELRLDFLALGESRGGGVPLLSNSDDVPLGRCQLP